MSLALKDGVIIPRPASLSVALEAMDRRGVGALVITDESGSLEGVLHDSAVRKHLAERPGAPLPALEDVLEVGPAAITEGALPADVAALMRERSTRYVVATDRFGRPAGMFTAHAIPGIAATTDALIMAGGQGSRLRPFTSTVPKPLLMVGQSPILEIIVRHLGLFGIRRIHLAVNYLSEKIKSYFQDGRNHGVEISYIEEKEALGTAGALRLLPTSVPRTLLVMNADLLTGLNVSTLVDVHENAGAMITMGLVPHRVEIPYGVAKVEGMSLQQLEEKPAHHIFINGGIYMVNLDALGFAPSEGALDMPTLINHTMRSGARVVGYPMRESWLDIGQLQDYQRPCATLSCRG